MESHDAAILIAPSILSADLAHLADEVQAVEAAGADWIHIDVMDGRFVPNLTFGMPLVRALRPVTTLPLDVHLMILEPERYIDAFAKAGADRVTVHAETCPHLERTLEQIREAGCKSGVAINPATPPDVLRYVLHRADLVLIMTVNPGFSGQHLIPHALPKIKQISAWAHEAGKSLDIQVDGGVNTKTASQVIQAGGRILVAGNAIFSVPSASYKDQITALRMRNISACSAVW